MRSHHGQFQSSGFLSVTWDLKLGMKSNKTNKHHSTPSPKYRAKLLLKLHQRPPETSQQNWIYRCDSVREAIQRSCEVCSIGAMRFIRSRLLLESLKEVGSMSVLVVVPEAELGESRIKQGLGTMVSKDGLASGCP